MTRKTFESWTSSEGKYAAEIHLAADCILGRGPLVDPAWLSGLALTYGRTLARVEADLDAVLASTVATI